MEVYENPWMLHTILKKRNGNVSIIQLKEITIAVIAFLKLKIYIIVLMS